MLDNQKNKVEKFLGKAGEVIDPIGKTIFGSLWRDVYDTLVNLYDDSIVN